MNYSRTFVEQHNSPRAQKKRSTRQKFVTTLIKTLLILIVIVIAAGLTGTFYYALRQIKAIPDTRDVSIEPSDNGSEVVDSEGRQLAVLSLDGAGNRYVKLSEIPEDLQHAFVAIEDERFYEHNGVDARGVIRAAFQGLTNGGHFSQGASTITQQVIKNNYFAGKITDRTFSDRLTHKIQEQYLAVQIEKTTSKATILETYLNTVSLGGGTIGVEAASEKYFNKNVKDLNLSECAVIAGIAADPDRYDPSVHLRTNARRHEKVLHSMYVQGYISRSDYENALDDNVYERMSTADRYSWHSSSYFTDALTDQVINDLKRRFGITESEAYMKLYTGGLTIHATLDSRLQQVVDSEINDKKNYSPATGYSVRFRLTVIKNGVTRNYSDRTMVSYYRKKDRDYTPNYASKKQAAAAYQKYRDHVVSGGTIPEDGENVSYTLQPQAAMTIIDQNNGRVLAISGGRGTETDSLTVNRATDITRQPGSAFSILSTYAPALDAGGMTLASVEDDAPTMYQNGSPLVNPDGRYRGFTTMREAIKESVSVVTAKTLSEIGTGLGYQYVKDFGLTTIKEGDNNPSLAEGILSSGVRNFELTAAYAAIADGGVYHRPALYTTVEDNRGEKLLDTTDDRGSRILKSSTAWLLTSAMKKTVSDGIAVSAVSTAANEKHDSIYAGYTPYYTGVVWGGYDDNSSLHNTSYTRKIWKSVMKQIHTGKKDKDFTMPDGISQTEVCRKSGKLPEEGVCENDPRGSMVVKEYFAAGTKPTETCDHHIRISICRESGLPASEFCPQSDIEEKVFITGGSHNTEDGKYMVDPSFQMKSCDIHTEGKKRTGTMKRTG